MLKICQICTEAYDPDQDETCRAGGHEIRPNCPLRPSTSGEETQTISRALRDENKTQIAPQKQASYSDSAPKPNTESPAPNVSAKTTPPSGGRANNHTRIDPKVHGQVQEDVRHQRPPEAPRTEAKGYISRGGIDSDNKGHTQFIPKVEKKSPSVCGWLVIVEGDMLYQDYPVHEGQNLIGSSDACDIAIPGIAKIHASLRCKEYNYYIVDCDSDDGTSVNGRSIETRTSLDDNSEIKLGNLSLKFKCFPPEE